MLEAYIKLLELGYYELQFALEGMAADKVWVRPAPTLLSVGEIAGHIAYWEAVRFAGEGSDLAQCKIKSPLVDNRFTYYPHTVPELPGPEHLALSAEDLYAEMTRVHQEAMAAYQEMAPDPDSPIPGCPSGFTYQQYLEYASFHIAYHIGQMYSVRHLLGEETPDN